MKTFGFATPVIALVAAAVVSTPAFAGDLTIAFPSAAPQGKIMVAVFNSAANYGGEGQPARYAVVDGAEGQVQVVFDNLPDGDYAVRAFHDLNGDGKMNANPFGMPTEPYAFSNKAVGMMGPATWEQAKFAMVGAAVQSIDLK
ncbi:MAG: DUF2141 domain-containing protein [Brevundimonas sp.]|uniref:DUF2141 domain-containing protein n=1 Tax=Brevundimonas sp. TaxID=1871086 RepID=UPI0028D5F129|nr:DUF2141 domain-containing protein [uncultured Brevundimonas sp.]